MILVEIRMSLSMSCVAKQESEQLHVLHSLVTSMSSCIGLTSMTAAVPED